MPFLIPVKLGLVGADGSDLVLNAKGDTEIVFELNRATQQLVVNNIAAPPVPSLLRGLSAPVKLNYDYSADQ